MVEEMKGDIPRRGTLSWEIVLDIGIDENGKRKQKWHSVKGTKYDAESEMVRLLHELQVGAYVEPNHLTLGRYLDLWLERRVSKIGGKILRALQADRRQ